jgi:hypothetical protein
MNRLLTTLAFLFFGTSCLLAQSAQGDGPHSQLIIRGVTLVNGNGAPPQGPIVIVVEGNTITQIQVVGYPGVPINAAKRPKLKPGGRIGL